MRINCKMWKKLIIILVLIAWLDSGLAKPKPKRKDALNNSYPYYGGTNFDYDYGLAAKRASSKYQKSNPTTTERPIVRYWNELMRNVRIPIPSLTWNMSNPLVNLFNGGDSNVMETPVGNYEYYTSDHRRRKNTRRRKNSQLKRSQLKRKRLQSQAAAEEEQEQPQQITLQPFSNDFDPNKSMYFYDPNSGQYYEVQRISAAKGQHQSDNYFHSKDILDSDEEKVQQTPAESTAVDSDENFDSSDAISESTGVQVGDKNSSELLSEGEDDAVAVVTQLDDDEPEREINMKEEVGTKKTEIKNEEMLRNVLGAYMSDDRVNRKRQRVSNKRNHAKLAKTRPRDNFRYYFLKGW